MASENGRLPEVTGKPASVNHTSAKPVLSVMEKLARQRRGEGERRVPDDPDFQSECPDLVAWLTATQIGEEFERDPAKLTLVCDGSYWSLTLMDPALEGSLSVLGNTFREALAALEGQLGREEAPWRYFKKRGQKALRPLERENKEGVDKKKKKK